MTNGIVPVVTDSGDEEDTDSKFNEFYVRKGVAKSELRRYIRDNPGRYTAVDLSGITGISVHRINRFLNDDKEFKEYAKKGMVAVPQLGGRPRWFNSNTPVVKKSYWRGAYALSRFHVQGDTETRKTAIDIDQSMRDLLTTSTRAPHNLLKLQSEIRDRIADQADALTISKQQTAKLQEQLASDSQGQRQLEDHSKTGKGKQ